MGHVEEDIRKLLERVIEKEGILNPTISINKGSENGDGYLGAIHIVVISGDNKDLNLVVKTAPKSLEFRKQVHIDSIYLNEIYFYDTISPTFAKFQADRGIKNPFNVAKCYATSTVHLKEGIVLENLKDRGYQLVNRKTAVDHEHMCFILKEYGKFHAISLALQDQNNELYRKVAEKLTDIYEKFVEDEKNNKAFQKMFANAKIALDPQTDALVLERFERFSETITKYQHDLISKNMDFHGVITHGDCWTNNMLFLYDDNACPRRLMKLRLLDWQMSRISSPAADITHFFYVSGSAAIFKNYKHYMDIYYESLSTRIKELGSNPDKVYPRSVFEEHWKLFCPNGLIMSLFMLKVLMADKEDIQDPVESVDSGKHILEYFDFQPHAESYNERIRDVILHFVENNFI